MRFKKFFVSFLVAVSVVTFSGFDMQQFLFEIAQEHAGTPTQQEQKTGTLYAGGRSVRIGMAYDDVLAAFGDPADVLPSEYGFMWNIFHDNYKNYIQIGVRNNRVVGIYTNAPDLSFCGVTAGMSSADVALIFESPMEYIIKGNTKYVMNGLSADIKNMSLFYRDGMYITFFYDTFKNNSVTSVNIIDYDTEQALMSLYAVPTKALGKSFEMQNFYVTNALRVREGLSPLTYHEKISRTAFRHSLQMAENLYFSHSDLSGGTVVDRAEKDGILFSVVGENIAMGAQNTLYMHELLMNSEGHRKNILANFRALGTGVAFSSDHAPYLTQNFLR